MGNSFEREEVTDLVVRRRSLRSTAMLGTLRLLATVRPFVGINSLLVQMVGGRAANVVLGGTGFPCGAGAGGAAVVTARNTVFIG